MEILYDFSGVDEATDSDTACICRTCAIVLALLKGYFDNSKVYSAHKTLDCNTVTFDAIQHFAGLRPLMLMIGNLPSRRGLFMAKLWASQILSKVCGVDLTGNLVNS